MKSKNETGVKRIPANTRSTKDTEARRRNDLSIFYPFYLVSPEVDDGCCTPTPTTHTYTTKANCTKQRALSNSAYSLSLSNNTNNINVTYTAAVKKKGKPGSSSEEKAGRQSNKEQGIIDHITLYTEVQVKR